LKVAEEELDTVPEGPLGVVKPVKVSVMDKLWPGGTRVPAGIKTPPVRSRVPPVDVPGKVVLLPPSDENWYTDPSPVSSVFNPAISLIV